MKQPFEVKTSEHFTNRNAKRGHGALTHLTAINSGKLIIEKKFCADTLDAVALCDLESNKVPNNPHNQKALHVGQQLRLIVNINDPT